MRISGGNRRNCNFPAGLILFLFGILLVSCKPGSGNHGHSPEEVFPEFRYVVVDSAGPADPWAKIAGDFTGDGKLEIAIGGRTGPLVWYDYPKMKHLISDGGYDTVDGEAADINGDGFSDIVMGGLYWYENPGDLGGNPDQEWLAHRIAVHPTHDIEVADLNGDGRTDIVSRNQSEFNAFAGNTIHTWLNLGPGNWEEDIIDCPHGEGLDVNDLDEDGDPDIIIGGIWFENSTAEESIDWKKHVFIPWHPNASIQVADFNGDGRKDIVLAPSELAGSFYRISWFSAPAIPDHDSWVEHVLADSVECVIHGMSIADLNQDGLQDIVYAEMHQGHDPDEVAVLFNRNNGTDWSKLVLSGKGSHYIQVADIDHNGLPDIFGANWSSDYQPVELWLNLGMTEN